jgi:hypothetical protein
MSWKSLFFLLLFSSLACAQVVSTGGYATTGGPMIVAPANAASAPLVATPDAALPGSGPAFGAPISTANTNDSRFSTGPSVYNPNGIVAGSEENTNATATANTGAAQPGTTSSGSAPATQPFEFGVQKVIAPEVVPSVQGPSLGEIARDLRAHHVAATRMITNETVARLNSANTGLEGLQQQNNTTVATAPATQVAQPAPLSSTAIARNESSALPQEDRSAAPQTAPATTASPTAAQQRHAVNPSTTSTSGTAEPAAQQPAPQATPAKVNSESGSQLPKTATYLPLLFLLGGIGVGAGAIYFFRR